MNSKAAKRKREIAPPRAGMQLGFATAYPANAWLPKRGIKEKREARMDAAGGGRLPPAGGKPVWTP